MSYENIHHTIITSAPDLVNLSRILASTSFVSVPPELHGSFLIATHARDSVPSHAASPTWIAQILIVVSSAVWATDDKDDKEQVVVE